MDIKEGDIIMEGDYVGEVVGVSDGKVSVIWYEITDSSEEEVASIGEFGLSHIYRKVEK